MDIYPQSKVKSLKNTYILIQIFFYVYTIYFCRREAIHVPFSRVPVAICPFRRVDAALSQTHRRQAIQMQSLWTLLCQIWSSCSSYEETFTKGTEATCSISCSSCCYTSILNQFNRWSRVQIPIESFFIFKKTRQQALLNKLSSLNNETNLMLFFKKYTFSKNCSKWCK